MQEVPINNASTKTRSRWIGPLLILLVGIISVVEFSSFLTSPSFSSEFPQFFTFAHGKTFSGLVALYRLFHLPWYRPTQFFLPYWIGDHFLSWHDPSAWRFCELLTMLMVCALIYGLVSQLLPGRRLAAFFAALYFTCVPTVYVPLYELFAFDFLHIVFTLLCVVAFIAGYRKAGFRGAALTGLAWLAYVIALTSKELTIVAPLYLLLVSLILLAMEPRPGSWRDRLMREALRLTPFWIMPAVYWAVHIRRIPKAAFNNAGDYRTGLNWSMIGRNAEKYPSWMARIYQHTLDNLAQAGGYATWRNELIGIALLVVVIVASIRLWRADPVYRKYILLAVAWILVFLLIPVSIAAVLAWQSCAVRLLHVGRRRNRLGCRANTSPPCPDGLYRCARRWDHRGDACGCCGVPCCRHSFQKPTASIRASSQRLPFPSTRCPEKRWSTLKTHNGAEIGLTVPVCCSTS